MNSSTFRCGVVCLLLALFLNLDSIKSNAQAPPTLSDVLENTLASVVTVAIYQTDYASTSVGRGSAAAISEEAYRKALDLGEHNSSGSGFIIDMNGIKYVVTNFHVISNAASAPGSIKVFSISRKAYEARLVGGDPFYDIALLEFVDVPGKEVTAVRFKTEEPRIGERVFAVGNPLGDHPYSVSDGIISAKNRVRGGLTAKFGYLQTTATVIWGNSGGPIVDEKGRVVGINSYIEFARDPNGNEVWQSQINYALEAKLANRFCKEIVANKGRITRSYLGIEFSNSVYWSDDGAENQDVQRLQEPPKITGVLPNSPASTPMRSKFGYQVVEVNGVEIRNLEELLGVLEETKPNTDVVFTLARDSVTIEKVTVRTTDLRNEHLEDIALFLLKKEKSISLMENTPYVGINFQPSRFRMMNGDPAGAVLNYGLTSQWKVVAAGSVAGAYNMYKVESLKDLGAAIRLSSMSGMLDLKMIAPDEDITNMRDFRYSFPAEVGMITAILYY